ncbi:hypothetical protein M9H77_10278 [Catharanthus roseus]|uniref:Uncharacterized protein n=1 Tax=Catharanthus roseus TaxID=4058 RepID=A0ACC0C2X7_CATRO|nr:hypothetical protein M9H77_10278 [Catharanthus roseus]
MSRRIAQSKIFLFAAARHDILQSSSNYYLESFCTQSWTSGTSPEYMVDFSSQRISSQERREHDLDTLIAKVCAAGSEDEVCHSLMCSRIQIDHYLVEGLLHRFKDDCKSSLGVLRWAESHEYYKPFSVFYDQVLDTLGKMKQMEKMRALVEEMNRSQLVSFNTIAKLMRRFAGAGMWEDAVRIFDQLENFGLEKNTDSMNLLLDTLCKERKVEQARTIFLELKSHIPPNANTFNIFIHGWCKVNRVDEAHWTIQEMKGHGCRPCVISYSIIIQSYCQQSNFSRVYELLDEMKDQNCTPNVVTFTTIMCSLTKSERFEESLQILERIKATGCKPDTLFYNALLHTLGRAGQVDKAIHVFKVEMPKIGVPPNTSTYNTMIAMFCHRKQERKALEFLKDMENSPRCKPDVQSYYPLLKSCFRAEDNHSFLSKLLDDMTGKHHLSFDLSTYTLLIHGLCRANETGEAYNLFLEMIGQGITPRYRTCNLLLDELKQKNMHAASERVEDYIKKMKSS